MGKIIGVLIENRTELHHVVCKDKYKATSNHTRSYPLNYALFLSDKD
jgi:hypothetical protein